MLILQILLNNYDLGLQLAVDPFTGVMAFSALASVLGGLFSNNQQADINAKNIAFQQQENALNRMFAREQMATQQQYNQLNAAQAYRRQREFYDYMYGKNTLKSMVDQAEEAGVNPFSLFDSQGFQGTSVPSVQQSSAATPVNAMGVAPHAEMIPSSFDKSVGAFSSIASALASLSQSGKNTAETESIKTKLHHEVNKLIAESDLLHDQDVKQELQNSLDAYFAFSEREKGLSKLDNEIASLNKSLLIKDEELTSAKFENSLNDIKRELKFNEKKMSDKRYEELSLTLDNLEENFRTMFALRRAQTEQAESAAAESSAKAETENALRPFIVRTQSALARLNENDAALKEESFSAEISMIFDEMQRSGIRTHQLQQALNKAIKENNIYYVKEILGMIRDIGEMGTDMYNAKKGKTRVYDAREIHYHRD